ncbi:hypothetical protein [Rhodococcoides fascians]|uniref:hypothetical protein n=1 Tax=Rhodococcoides fascians TaxID=1828 RepID=UPI00050BDBDC|nr:hypothetical protein [Rhodococcus fascians]
MTATIAPDFTQYIAEPERVILRGTLGQTIAGYRDGDLHRELHWAADDDTEQAALDALEQLEAEFKVIGTGSVNKAHLADDDFYRGINCMSVIQRRTDGQYFGFAYWDPATKHDSVELEANGDEHGLEVEWDDDRSQEDWDALRTYVFTPVYPFVIHGYRHPKDGK